MTEPPLDPRSGSRNDPAPPGALGKSIPQEVIRSEERLNVRTDVRTTKVVRLRKRVVTEEVTHTVSVRREELVVEEEVLDGPAAQTGGRFDFDGDRDLEIVLHEERVVTSTRVVPVERVRVRVRTVTDEVAVNEVLRSEEIDVQTMPRTEIDTGGRAGPDQP